MRQNVVIPLSVIAARCHLSPGRLLLPYGQFTLSPQGEARRLAERPRFFFTSTQKELPQAAPPKIKNQYPSINQPD